MPGRLVALKMLSVNSDKASTQFLREESLYLIETRNEYFPHGREIRAILNIEGGCRRKRLLLILGSSVGILSVCLTDRNNEKTQSTLSPSE
jgi:hypothetical protein